MEPRLIDTNRYVVRVSTGLRADDFYPKQPFWLFADPNVPVPTMDTFSTLVLLQRVLREPQVQRVTITKMTTDLEMRVRKAAPKSVPLDSFLTKEGGGE